MSVLRSLALVSAAATAAHADTWIVAEAPAAIPVSDAQSGVFRPGIMPAFGLYDDRGAIALGARVRAGVLRNGPAPGDNLNDPGVGGLVTAGVALRGAYRGGWIEAVGGAGVTGRDFVPVVEAGLGWDFSRGTLDLGPSVRYVRVVAHPAMGFGSADLVLVGLDVRFGKSRPAPVPLPVPVAVPAPVPDPTLPVDSDRDRLLDVDAGCIADPDGCPFGSGIVVHDDRIVLDDRVLFDTDRAHVKARGREIIQQVVAMWHDHPEWKRITIEGHADTRGSDDYNLELSQRRAERVRDVFVRYGAGASLLSAIGYGRTRPRDPGDSPEAHEHNRRVEFVIERGEP